MTSDLGFKTRVDSLTCMLRQLCNGFLRFTSGVTPTDLLAASKASSAYFHKQVGLFHGFQFWTFWLYFKAF